MDFEKLSPEVKEKVIEALRIPLGDPSWLVKEEVSQFCNESWGGNHKTLPDIGLSADPKEAQYEFASYRGTDHFTPKSIDIIDNEKFVEFLGLDKRTWQAKAIFDDIVSISIGGSTGSLYSSAINVTVEYWEYPEHLTPEQTSERESALEELSCLIEEKVTDHCAKFVKWTNNAIEAGYADEAITETIIINEYDFCACGEIKHKCAEEN